ncbi:hypothetical protein AC626_25825 [Pseudoalteromonas rubra]|uniref:Uncharacterized protein n=1 Tax=Pseudoalteromonas rubra TaxID=43658 RepID=A0A0L0EKU1_9GAMM|nr:hypothetical protein AC626_25825 [Pseudoalteromonas rubra]
MVQLVTQTLIVYAISRHGIQLYTMSGDGIDNQGLRDKLNQYDYGSATLPVKDSRFLTNLNRFKPSGYPTYSTADVLAAQ